MISQPLALFTINMHSACQYIQYKLSCTYMLLLTIFCMTYQPIIAAVHSHTPHPFTLAGSAATLLRTEKIPWEESIFLLLSDKTITIH